MKVGRAITRETNAVDPSWHRRLMIRVDKDGLYLSIWQKGRRTKYRVPYAAVWRLAVKMRQDEIAADRKAKGLPPRRGRKRR